MNTRDTMLHIAREAIICRAAIDGDAPDAYDPEVDEEGFVISLLIALHHWSDAHGHDWHADLRRAQALYEEDLEELREGEPATARG